MVYISSWPYPLDDFCYESPSLRSSRPSIVVRYVFIRDSYHDAVRKKKNRNKIPRPDCVTALNCGFVFYKVNE